MKTGSYFPHDSNAKDDPKCMLLIDQLGLEGYGIFWMLIETLRDQPEFSYPLNHTSILAKRYNTSKEKIDIVIYNFNLFQINNDIFFYSESLINRMAEIATKKLKQSDGGKKGMLNRWKNNQLQLSDNHAVNNLVITNLENENNLLITSKVKESKVKESKVKESKVKEIYIPDFSEFKKFALENKQNIDLNSLELKYKSWSENGWKNGNGKEIENWKSTLLNTIPYLKETVNGEKSHNLKRI